MARSGRQFRRPAPEAAPSLYLQLKTSNTLLEYMVYRLVMANWGFLTSHAGALMCIHTTPARGCATSRPGWASPSAAPTASSPGPVRDQAERRPPQPLPDPGAPGGRGVERPHLPHRLVCTDSYANTASIIAVIKTQGSDTKPVGQMQPYYEAKSLRPVELAGRQVPPLVTQIADGENGGVMTNEFPPKYLEVMRECSGSPTPAVNVTEYLEALAGRGISREDPPPVQPLLQHRV